jgi:hypothetical protein
MKRAGFFLVLVVAAVTGCKRSPPGAAAAPSASVAPSASEKVQAPVGAARCRVASGDGQRLLLGPGAPPSSEDDEAVDLPFAPEIGGAAVQGGLFAVGALEPRGKSTNAVLLLVGEGLAAGKKVDLGAVHGDVLAPHAVATGGGFVVAVPDGAPHGTLLRLARIDEPAAAARIAWGAELLQNDDDSDAFAIDAGSKSALLAWDDWDKKAGHSIVKAAVLAGADVTRASAALVLSGEHDDAEAPAVVARPGGFWVAWIDNVKRAPDHKEQRHESSDPAETSELEMGPRYVVLAPFDEAGKPAGAPVMATPREGHVMGFDLALGRDGGALITWRDDRSTPGTAGGTVRLELVRSDGSMESRVITDDDVGPGAPSLVADPATAGGVHAWLTLANDADALRLVALDADGRALDDLAVEPSLGMATALSLRAGKLLVSRPAGKGLELQVLSCEKGVKAGAP